eukprot:483729-Amphidinium_carterae.1
MQNETNWVCDSVPSKSLLRTNKALSPATALLGSVPAKRLLCAYNARMLRSAWSPLSGSVPSKPLELMKKPFVTALIVRMPLSGIVPVKLFEQITKALAACNTWSPLSGSAPLKPFLEIENPVSVLIVRMPLSGIVPFKAFPSHPK